MVSTTAGLKSNAACSVSVADSVVDKDGNKVPALTGVSFKTDVLKATAPTATVDKAMPITISFNGRLDAATITGITIRKMGAGADTAATVELDTAGTKVLVKPAAPLDAMSKYEITVPATVTDAFGGAFPAAATLTVTTGM